MDLTNVKSGAMSRTRESRTRGSARVEGVYEQREYTGGGRAEWPEEGLELDMEMS